MSVHRLAIAGLLLGLCSIVLTLGVWAWIFAQPVGSFRDQGGMTISLICFPLCVLGWLVAGGAAIALGVAVLTTRSGESTQPSTTCFAAGGVLLGIMGLPLALATLMIA